MSSHNEMDRREFLLRTLISAASLTAVTQATGCGGSGSTATSSSAPLSPLSETSAVTPSTLQPVQWPISRDVVTTVQRVVVPSGVSPTAPHLPPADVGLYAKYGYGAWTVAQGLPPERRLELAPGHEGAVNVARLLSYFTISDIHLADKESPAQANYIGWSSGYGQYPSLISSWSPIVVATVQVLDAAVQTINALHKQTPFDFGMSLGDNVNNSQYNELRWFIDCMDGKVITPSSGAHVGADTIDYQKPFKAAGLDPSLPWYQVVGNHDQFWMGSSFENAKTRAAHIGADVLNMSPNPNPAAGGINGTGAYMGVVDGTTPLGVIIKGGPQQAFSTPPTVVADPNRHTLATPQSTTLGFMTEFFNTTSTPIGHGFTQANLAADFACYSFVPKAGIPLKIIVLDDTVKGPDAGGYASASLDKRRLDWLTAELQAGQDARQLMAVAAHIPIAPQNTLTDPTPFNPALWNDPAQAQEVLALLHSFPNFILWMSGHRHINVVTPQPTPDATRPELSFWEVETPSLRDYPQQFRTFDIRRNDDNSISILVIDVDPAVTPDSPAGKSRSHAIGASQTYGVYPPAGTASQTYNAELVLQLSAEMQQVFSSLGAAL